MGGIEGGREGNGMKYKRAESASQPTTSKTATAASNMMPLEQRMEQGE